MADLTHAERAMYVALTYVVFCGAGYSLLRPATATDDDPFLKLAGVAMPIAATLIARWLIVGRPGR